MLFLAGEDGREYTIAYYKRDTRRGVDWNYSDAEGGCALPTTHNHHTPRARTHTHRLEACRYSRCRLLVLGFRFMVEV